MIKRYRPGYGIIIMMSLILMTSCNGDNPNPIPPGDIPDADGFYVFGTNTIAGKAIDPDAKMPKALLDPEKSGGNTEKDGILGRLLYIGANSTVSIAEVVDGSYTAYGLPNGGELKPGFDISSTNIRSDMIQGTLLVDEDPINISAEGLYYLFILGERKEIRILEVQPEIIGDATSGLESTGTPLALKSISRDSAVFEITEIPLTGSAGYKYRFARGWELYNGPLAVTFTYLGVESYDVSRETGFNNIGYYNEECAQVIDGKYSLQLIYNMNSGEWKENKIYSGDLPQDYTNLSMSIFGNAYLIAPGDTANWRSGTDGYEPKMPAVEGNVYTWTWAGVELLKDRQFIFLENGEWGGLEINYATVGSVSGQAIDDNKIVDSSKQGSEFNDFYVLTEGAYDIQLVINEDQKSSAVLINNAK